MYRKMKLDKNGILKESPNLPTLPNLILIPKNDNGKKLARIHSLIKTSKPKICFYRGEGIGDVIMTTPTVRFISEQYPTAEITYATNLKYLDGALSAVLEENPYIDKVVDWNTLNKIDYDVVSNLHCPCIAHEVPKAKPINRIDIFADHVGIDKLNNPLPVYVVKKEEKKWASDFIFKKLKLSNRDKVVILSPFASNKWRSIPLKTIKEFITGLRNRNTKILLLTHSSDYIADIPWENYVDYVAKDLKVRQVAALINESDLLVCPDSAALHIAGALEKQVIGIFGPTDAYARVNHYTKAIGYWPGSKLECSPCWYSSHNCAKQSCWKMIDPNYLVEISRKVLTGDFKFKDKEIEVSTKFKTRGQINTEIL